VRNFELDEILLQTTFSICMQSFIKTMRRRRMEGGG